MSLRLAFRSFANTYTNFSFRTLHGPTRTLRWSQTYSLQTINRRWSSSTGGSNGTASSEGSVKLWGGRFSQGNDPLMERFNASFHIDKRMWKEDLHGSMAYANALQRCGLLTVEENEIMQKGLKEVEAEWQNGNFQSKPSDEDIHTANERRLTELIGSEVAGKLHTGRSRNDQCITDFKLWMKSNIPTLVEKIDAIISTIVGRFDVEKNSKTAEEELERIISGYTHLQQAQCVRWSHYLLAFAFMFKRDALKFRNNLEFVSICPLGSGAIAGHSFFGPDDRKLLAKELGFTSVTENSMDAISNRDFVLDFLFNCSITCMHMSRLHEDLIILNSSEFGVVEMSDLYSTGSSLMPQKKNPDACEIVRGKAGSVVGNMVSFFVTLKGLPLTYNKDLQDDKKIVFDTFDVMVDCLEITRRVLETLKLKGIDFENGERDNLFATDLADYLVRKKVPFRKTHHIAGEAVQLSEDKGVPLSRLSFEDFSRLHPLFEQDVKSVFDPNHSVEMKNAEGSTSKRAVLEQIDKVKRYLNSFNSSSTQR